MHNIRPEKDLPENHEYNYNVSAVRIRSEHCVGWLKGRFPCMKGLRLRIDEEAHVQYASLWLQGCILIHNFAVRAEGGVNMERDTFFREGREYMEELRTFEEEWREECRILRAVEEATANEDARLLAGKMKREELKRHLFEYLHQ